MGPGAYADSEVPSAVFRAREADFTIELPETQIAAGTHTIEVANEGSSSHDLAVEDAAGTEVAAAS